MLEVEAMYDAKVSKIVTASHAFASRVHTERNAQLPPLFQVPLQTQKGGASKVPSKNDLTSTRVTKRNSKKRQKVEA